MRRILIGTFGLIFLVLGAGIAVAVLTPDEVYKERIETAAAGALGREVSLNGDVGLSFFPRIAASVEDVTVANPDGFTDEHLVRAGALRASVKWAPLFTGRVEVSEIAFVDANVSLERLADGQVNWELANSDAPSEPADPASPTEINAGVDRARLVNASIIYRDAMTEQIYELTDFNIDGSVTAFDQPLTARGDGVFDGDGFSFAVQLTSPQAVLDGQTATSELSFNTGLVDVSFTGEFALGETPNLAGSFDISAPDIAALAAKAEIDPQTLPIALEPFGGLTARGNVTGPLDALVITFEEAAINGDEIDVKYRGQATIAETQSLDGRIDVASGDIHALLLASGIELEPAQTAPLKGASLSLVANLSGPADALRATGIDFDLSGPLMTASYDGNLSLAGDGNLNGRLAASSDQLRALLSAAAIELAPGETLQSFDVSGNASGAFNRLAISGLALNVDDITASGDISLRTDTPRPMIIGTLVTGPLDLTPFMGPPPESQPKGWSKTPLALDSLKTADADITLQAASVTIDKITLSDAKMAVKLTNGALDTNIEQFRAFGGNWRGDINLNANAATPTLTMAMSADSILMEQILQVFANTDRLTGGGQFQLNLTGRGESLEAIMNSLNGDLTANLSDGALKGVNLGQLVRSATDLRSSLSSGAFNLGLSPSEQSDFSAFNSVLKIRNGVANIELMEIVSSTFGANGLGEINLGQQTLDMALRVAADTTGAGELVDVQVNNVGIPLLITGDWTAPKIRPDTAVLTQLLAGNVLGDIGGQLGGNIGDALDGDIGSLLGNVLGGNSRDEPTTPPASTPTNPDDEVPTDNQDPEEEEEPATVEDAVEDLARDALGGLFGRGDQ